MSRHIKELDSVRGLAALSVVFYHFSFIFPLIANDTSQQSSLWLINIFKYSPLRAAFAGYEAVLLFLILSGFVLSLPFYSAQPITYPAFLIRRICRIYLPYLGAVAVAVTLDAVFSRHGISTLSEWFNKTWSQPPTLALIIKHLVLVDSFDSAQYDPVLWSLVQEMRLSLIFPLLMLFSNRYNWKFSLGLGIAVGTFGSMLYYGYLSYTNDLSFTLEGIGLFITGALLAKYRVSLVEAYCKLPGWSHYLLFGGGLLCYTFPWWMGYRGLLSSVPAIDDIVAAIGCAIMLMLALSSSRLSRLLLRQPLPFLGKISYSLYLYHAIVLFTMLNVLYGVLTLWLILPLAFVSTLIVASIGWYAIEAPAIALGKYLSTHNSRLLKSPQGRLRPEALRRPATAEQIQFAEALTVQASQQKASEVDAYQGDGT
jgi:peptidoglycan/LPS O-acetylase OafA/YrhL